MPIRNVPIVDGHYYHVFNRAVEGRQLFYSKRHYLKYLKLWNEVDFTPACRVLAYCLMPNHFHCLVLITSARLFVRKISYFLNKYLKFLNAVRDESGPYFRNRFKAKVIEDEKYLIGVCGYIHLNPMKGGLVKSLDEWPYSNYLEFVGKRQGLIFDEMFYDEYIGSPEEYREFLCSRYSEDVIEPYVLD
jgi:putative transposase